MFYRIVTEKAGIDANTGFPTANIFLAPNKRHELSVSRRCFPIPSKRAALKKYLSEQAKKPEESRIAAIGVIAITRKELKAARVKWKNDDAGYRGHTTLQFPKSKIERQDARIVCWEFSKRRGWCLGPYDPPVSEFL